MGKCQTYLVDLIQTFTDIRALKVMNMCHIITIYLNENKNNGPKNIVTVEPGIGSIRLYIYSFEWLHSYTLQNEETEIHIST